MKILKLLSLFVLALLFSQCGTTESLTNSTPPSLVEVAQLLSNTESKFIEYRKQPGNTPKIAIEQTNAWVQTQQNVASTYTLDSIYIYIKLTSGITTTFCFNEVDADGYSLFRGGERTTSRELLPLTSNSKNTIDNLNVLIYAGAYSEFYKPGEMNKITGIFNTSGLGLNVTLLKDKQCTYDILEQFGNYGFVIIDSHGMPDALRLGTTFDTTGSYSEELLKQTIITAVGAKAHELILSGDIRIGKMTPLTDGGFKPFYIMDVTTKYINKLPQMPKTVIFGNMCYSGQLTEHPDIGMPIRTAFLNRNPISYYCYSQDNGRSSSVEDGFSKSMEDSLVRALTVDGDSTGIANLRSDGSQFFDQYASDQTNGRVKLYFKHFGADDYSYDDCVDTFIDARDNHVYKAVCLGKQVWMAENLKYDGAVGYCYDSLTLYCTKYGRLYPWSVAMGGSAASNAIPSGVQGICPKGWHIPSEAEWDVLFTYLGGRNEAGNYLRAQPPLWNGKNGGADSVGFNALPGGHAYWVGTKDDLRLTFPGGPSHSTWSRHALFLTSSMEGANPKAISLYAYSGVVSTVTYGNAVDPYQPALNTACRCVKD